MTKQREQHRQPKLTRPTVKDKRASADEQRQVPASLKPGLGIAAPRQLTQQTGARLAAIPVNAQGLADFRKFLVSHVMNL